MQPACAQVKNMVAQMFSLQELFFCDEKYTDPKPASFSDPAHWEALAGGHSEGARRRSHARSAACAGGANGCI